jgi:hypothetical protein
VLFDDRTPRYLPHLEQPEVLAMGLSPLAHAPWIETDTSWLRYHRHKLSQRQEFGQEVYRAQPHSLPAQRELARMLLRHLSGEQEDLYRLEDGRLVFLPLNKGLALDSSEPLWNCSLWVADDLVIMQRQDANYCLSAASLSSPSGWRLGDKFGRPMAEIHSPIPGFEQHLTPSVDRFLAHLKVAHPVVRYNWSLQAGDGLDQRQPAATVVDAATPLYYRTERQSLRRLPQTGAIVFTIRVYLHPLESLSLAALGALFRAVQDTPPALARYKGFTRLAPAIARHRAAAGPTATRGNTE